MEATIEQFKNNVFSAIDLKDVIWVDDRFAASNDSIKEDYLKEIQARIDIESTKELEEFVPFKGIDFSESFKIIKDEIPTDDSVIISFYSHLKIESPDFTTSQFDELINIFDNNTSGNVHKLSLAEWEESKENFLSDDAKHLYLIDYNFEHEGRPSDYGKEVIKDILSRDNIGNSYCVLFTSEAQHGKDEEDRRTLIVSDLDESTDTHNFSVLSKSIIDENNSGICLKFKSSEFIKRVFLRKLSSEMVQSLAGSIFESIRSIQQELSQKSIYEIDASIFNSSLSEGASELELLHRIFSIKQSDAMYRTLLSDPTLASKLRGFRSVQQVSFNQSNPHKKYLNKLNIPSEMFSNLRNLEIFEPNINEIHSPLFPGDIFEFRVNDKKISYILIEQGCDLAVRGDTGLRKLNEATLIPFELKKQTSAKKKEKDRDPKFHLIEVPSIEDGSLFCVFDFSEAITVNINLLELCVYNTNGEISFDYNSSLPSLLYLPGWIQRFNNLKRKMLALDFESLHVDIPANLQVFSLASNKNFTIKISSDKISLNGARVKKLREPFIGCLIKDYYLKYKLRVALAHDFS